MSRQGKCPCLSQSDDSIVFCQKDEGHEGLHEWRDPVHPGHSKMWAGSVTTIQTDTRYRYESVEAMRKRFGLRINAHGGVEYRPMAQDIESVDHGPLGDS